MILLAVFLPLVAGFLCLVLHRGLRTIPILAYGVTAGVGLQVLLAGEAVSLHLKDLYGISLLLQSRDFLH